MWFHKRSCCCCCCKDVLYQILFQLVKIECALKDVPAQAVELQLKAGSPEIQHGFMNVGGT